MAPQVVRFCTPSTCCGCHCGSHSSARCQSSAPEAGVFKHLPTVNNFLWRFLHLLQLRHKVPEAERGHDMVRYKDAPVIEGWCMAFGGGQAAPHHLALSQHARGLHRVLCEFAATHKSHARHFVLLTVSWEPAHLAGIIRKSWGMDLARKHTGNFSAFPWRALPEKRRYSSFVSLLAFRFPGERLIT